MLKPSALKRAAAVILPLFSARTTRSLGRGEIPDLIESLDWLAEMGQRVVQLLPLSDTGPNETSPYNALSIFAIDPLYLSVRELPGVSRAAFERARERLTGRPAVARLELHTLKMPMLRAAWRHFQSAGASAEHAALAEFVAANRDWLSDYALFRALKERFGWRSWNTWPALLREREPAALARARAECAEAVAMFSYWQFLAARQWAEVRAAAARRGVSLGGDLAFSPARDSAEVWGNPDLFDCNRSVGAPPDGFSPAGQRWGLPMPVWSRMRADGFKWWRMRARQARGWFDLLRLDHVVGFYRTFSFGPRADDPGAFYPPDEPAQLEQGEAFLAALLAELGSQALIAEDLGDVPPWVKASLRAHGVPGLKVFRWERENWGAPDERFISPADYPQISVAVTGTHDTDTLAAWWSAAPAAERVKVAQALALPAKLALNRPRLDETLLDALLEALYDSPAILTMTPVQDLFGWEERINLPGSVRSSNWSWRLPMPLARLREQPTIRARMAAIGRLARRSGRA